MGAFLQWPTARGVAKRLASDRSHPVDLQSGPQRGGGGACNGDKSTLYSNFAQKQRRGEG